MDKKYYDMPTVILPSCYNRRSRYGLLPVKGSHIRCVRDPDDNRIYVLKKVPRDFCKFPIYGIDPWVGLLFVIPNMLTTVLVSIRESTIIIVSPLIETNFSSNLDIRKVFVDEFRFLYDCYQRGILINPCRMYVRYGMDNKPHFCSLKHSKIGGDEELYDFHNWPWCYLPPECNRNENTFKIVQGLAWALGARLRSKLVRIHVLDDIYIQNEYCRWILPMLTENTYPTNEMYEHNNWIQLDNEERLEYSTFLWKCLHPNPSKRITLREMADVPWIRTLL